MPYYCDNVGFGAKESLWEAMKILHLGIKQFSNHIMHIVKKHTKVILEGFIDHIFIENDSFKVDISACEVSEHIEGSWRSDVPVTLS